ncbi:RNB domain-containing protein [Aphelenchoides besseyi]|nr:RNB domain-containing protein [Aphelenchoides besseyi]
MPSAINIVMEMKPQYKYGFAHLINNRSEHFVPRLKVKHHSMTGDDYMGEILYRSSSSMPRHPYHYEVLKHETPSWQLEKPIDEIMKSKSLDKTPLILIDTTVELNKLIDVLNKSREFAVDLEFHNLRSFLGITCLIQISTRESDYIIDPFSIWEYLHVLNEPFTNPNIRKVFHGAHSDLMCLQRDFGIYAVNLLDTKELMEEMEMPKPSLQTLVKDACGVWIEKESKTADWRHRPLDAHLLKYARSDTHYLLESVDWLSRRVEGDFSDFMTKVYNRCRFLCQHVFLQPIFQPFGYRRLLSSTFTSGQISTMKKLWAFRDALARAEDERTEFLIPDRILTQITKTMPADKSNLRKCFSSYSINKVVQSKLDEILEIIENERTEIPIQGNDDSAPQKPTVSTVLETFKQKKKKQANPEPVNSTSQTPGPSAIHNFDVSALFRSFNNYSLEDQLKRIDLMHKTEPSQEQKNPQVVEVARKKKSRGRKKMKVLTNSTGNLMLNISREAIQKCRPLILKICSQRTLIKHLDASNSRSLQQPKSSQIVHGRNRLKHLNRQYGSPNQKIKQIVGLMQKHEFTGVLEKTNGNFTVTPHNRRLPVFRVVADEKTEQLVNKQVTCTYELWRPGKPAPLAKVVGALNDDMEAIEAEIMILMSEYGIRNVPFTPGQLQNLPDENWQPENPLPSYREDLRYLDICSIDPLECSDIDDVNFINKIDIISFQALHFRVLENGHYEVGVHIADVSHFVKPSSPLDVEASRRCTTVYLCDRRIDMLPEILSTNICSLHANEPRYAFSVIWVMDAHGRTYNTRFTKSLIRSKHAYSYEEAQATIDDQMDQSVLAKSLRGLRNLSRIMQKERQERGALMLANMDICFDYNATGQPVSVQEKKCLETYSLIEEFMLKANVSVAERLLEFYPKVAMLRRHPTPSLDMFEPLIRAAKALNFEIDTSSNEALSDSLNKAVDPNDPDVNRLLRIITTYCMTLAIYFPAGASPDDRFHYGLAAPLYTHFTSPIRRYADIIVHRQLAASLGLTHPREMPRMFSRIWLDAESNDMNSRGRNAKRAARASALLHAKFLLEKEPKEAYGFVTDVFEKKVKVVVMDYGATSTVKYPPNCNVKLQLMQKVRVRLSVQEINERRFINMEILDPPLHNENAEVEPDESDGI